MRQVTFSDAAADAGTRLRTVARSDRRRLRIEVVAQRESHWLLLTLGVEQALQSRAQSSPRVASLVQNKCRKCSLGSSVLQRRFCRRLRGPNKRATQGVTSRIKAKPPIKAERSNIRRAALPCPSFWITRPQTFESRDQNHSIAEQGARANAGICHAACDLTMTELKPLVAEPNPARSAPVPGVAHL